MRQEDITAVLRTDGPMTPREIADRLGVKPWNANNIRADISHALYMLEKYGIVRRVERSPKDNRQWIWELVD